MDTLEAIQQRRAVKYFDPHHQMTEEEINRLLSLTVLSPTSSNVQNWRFVLVQDRLLRAKIREAAWDQPQVTDASLLIILCATKSFYKDAERYYTNIPEEKRKVLAENISAFYADKEELIIDEGHRSCGIAAQTMMLAAKAMGYDSCPLVGFDFKKVGKLIRLPKDHIISMMVVLGKALKPAFERGDQLPLKEVIIHNHF